MARLGVVGQVFHLASNSLNQHVRRSFSNSLTVIARLEIAPIVYTRNLGLHWQLRLLSRSHHNSKRTNKTVKRYLKSLTLATNLNKEVPVFLCQPPQDVLFFLLYLLALNPLDRGVFLLPAPTLKTPRSILLSLAQS